MSKNNCSQFTATYPVSKKFWLNKDNGLQKDSGGQIWSATCVSRSISTPAGLVELLGKLGPKNAMAWGSLKNGRTEAKIRSRAGAKEGDVTRTRDNFEFPSGTAIMMLDIDEIIPRDELIQKLQEVLPELKDAPYVVADSASSHIYNGDVCLKGEGGKRVYIFVKDGKDIPRAAVALGGRLKLAGHLHYDISKSGSLLERTLIDEAVFQPERLDFCGGAQCAKPLIQKRPSAEAFNNDTSPLDTSSVLPDLTREEQNKLDSLCGGLKFALVDKANEARKTFSRNSAKVFLERQNVPITEKSKASVAEKIYRAVEGGLLPDELILYPQGGGEVSVGEVRKNPAKWDGKKFADPIDPAYYNDNRIAMAQLRGPDPRIFSFAHGGQIYKFEHQAQKTNLHLTKGALDKVVTECLSVMAKEGVVYQRGGELVRMATQDQTIIALNSPWLRNYLDSCCAFFKPTEKELVRADCPNELAERVMSLRGEWCVPELKGVTNLPFMRPDGSIVYERGYDERTQIFLSEDFEIDIAKIQRPGRRRLAKALKNLFKPFKDFPFEGPVDRGVLLAALLTAAIRPWLKTAPGFFVGAPSFGTGKTLLASAIAESTGKKAMIQAWPDQEAEQRKMLVSTLRSNPENIILDNLTGSWNSTDLAAIMTTEDFSDRVLGKSEIITVQTNCLVLATGNNVSVSGDLARRILVITLDAGTERPDQRDFNLNPVEFIKNKLLQVRCDVLTVLCGFMAKKCPRVVAGGMGSFEDWERLVRQAVCWVAQQKLAPVEVGDPLESIDKNFEEDVDISRLRSLMHFWKSVTTDPHSLRTIVLLAQANSVCKPEPKIDPVTNCAVKDETGVYDCFLDILLEIAGKNNEVNTRILGGWMRKNQKRVVDGMYIVQGNKKQKMATWKVVCVQDRAEVGDNQS